MVEPALFATRGTLRQQVGEIPVLPQIDHHAMGL